MLWIDALADVRVTAYQYVALRHHLGAHNVWPEMVITDKGVFSAKGNGDRRLYTPGMRLLAHDEVRFVSTWVNALHLAAARRWIVPEDDDALRVNVAAPEPYLLNEEGDQITKETLRCYSEAELASFTPDVAGKPLIIQNIGMPYTTPFVTDTTFLEVVSQLFRYGSSVQLDLYDYLFLRDRVGKFLPDVGCSATDGCLYAVHLGPLRGELSTKQPFSLFDILTDIDNAGKAR